MTTPISDEYQSGFAALVGRPNVGKSTLLNELVGQKVSIITPKAQTTRHQILGIKTTEHYQIIYVDTPGLHRSGQRALNRYMNRTTLEVLERVDLVIWLVTALQWTENDYWTLEKLKASSAPVLLAVNKIDTVTPKERLLPYLNRVSELYPFLDMIPISARKGTQVELLEQRVVGKLPKGEPYFPEDQVTDRDLRFLASEFIREKLTHFLHQELPYGLTVSIEEFKETQKIVNISAVIYVEREGQRKIIIGKDGEGLKKVGTSARIDLETMLDRKVYLKLWVKIKEGWPDDERTLPTLGYTSQ